MELRQGIYSGGQLSQVVLGHAGPEGENYMSDVVFRCPGCEKNLCAGGEAVGTSLQCPDCEKQFTVPDPDMSFKCKSCGVDVRAPSALAGEVFDCASCGKSFTVPASASGAESEAAGPQVEITCPSCSVVLEVDADVLKEMAGQSLDCPECNGKIPVPAASPRKLSVAASGVLVSASTAARNASSCPECHVALAKDAVLCTSCGFDLRTGKKLSAESGESGKLAVKSAEPVTGINELNPMLSRYALPQAKEKTSLEKMMPYLKIGGVILAFAVVGGLAWYFADDLRGLFGGKKAARLAAPARPVGAGKAVTNNAVTVTNRLATNVTAGVAAKAVTNAVAVAPELKIVKNIITSIEIMQKVPGDAAAMQELSVYIRNLVETNDTRAIKAGIMAIFALGQLGKGNEPSGLAGCALIKKNYQDTEFAGMVSRENFYDPCPRCGQSGKEVRKCDSCDGKGTRNKSGKCLACKGVGSFSVKCRNCAGIGKVLVKVKVKIMYDSAITKTLVLLAARTKSGIDLVMKADDSGTGAVDLTTNASAGAVTLALSVPAVSNAALTNTVAPSVVGK